MAPLRVQMAHATIAYDEIERVKVKIESKKGTTMDARGKLIPLIIMLLGLLYVQPIIKPIEVEACCSLAHLPPLFFSLSLSHSK